MPLADTPVRLPPITVTLTVALFLQCVMRPLICTDMIVYLVPWFAHVVATGPIAAFAAPFSNYTPAYLYLLAATTTLAPYVSAMTLIKALSLLGTAALAGGTAVADPARYGTAGPRRGTSVCAA